MTRGKALLGVCIVGILLFAVVVFGPKLLIIRVVYKDFPGGRLSTSHGGSLTLKAGDGQAWRILRAKEGGFSLQCAGVDKPAPGYTVAEWHQMVEFRIKGCQIESPGVRMAP